jgi:transposase InsO family protein
MARKVVAMEHKLLAVFSSGLDLDVTALCGQLGISRQTLYKYRRRWLAEGVEGLVERSRRPHRSPLQVGVAVEDAILRLRKELVVDNGAQTIAYHLARQPERLAGAAMPSVATIHRVLVRRGAVVPQPKKRPRSSWTRFEWPRPNDAWQIDATAWALADGEGVWIMDSLDDHSRLMVASRVCDGPTSGAVWDAFTSAVTEWGLPARMMSDNGVCFTGRFHHFESDFERQLRDMGIDHLLSGPGHPQTCGKLERSHQTTKKWLATRPRASTREELQIQLDEWRGYYNFERPHRALSGATPRERWLASPRAEPGEPIPGTRRASLHRVDSGGKIGWSRYLIGIDSRLAGQQVLVVANDLDLAIHGQAGVLRRFTIDASRRYQPNGRPPGRRST